MPTGDDCIFWALQPLPQLVDNWYLLFSINRWLPNTSNLEALVSSIKKSNNGQARNIIKNNEVQNVTGTASSRHTIAMEYRSTCFTLLGIYSLSTFYMYSIYRTRHKPGGGNRVSMKLASKGCIPMVENIFVKQIWQILTWAAPCSHPPARLPWGDPEKERRLWRNPFLWKERERDVISLELGSPSKLFQIVFPFTKLETFM